MADDTQGTPDATGPTPAQPTSASVGSRSGAGMVAVGGMAVIAGYVVFGLILNEYWVAWLPLLLAIVAVLLPRIDTSFVEKIAPLGAATKAVGYLLAIIGAVAILEDIRFAGSQLDSFVEILGAVVAYAGYAAAYLGARSIDA